MTFNPGADISGGQVNASRGGGLGGRGLVIGGGGGGCLMVVLLIIYMIMGGNPLALLGATEDGTQVQQSSSPGDDLSQECQTGEDANRDDRCLVRGVIASADAVWADLAPQNGFRFSDPRGVLFSGSVQTACGAATTAVGPFYCPGDDTIYIDTTFYQELTQRFGASDGQLAKEYVIAHEYGHHIQNLQGILKNLDHSKTGPQSDSVRSELQADCYAGIWAHYASSTKDSHGTPFLEPLTQQDIDSALSAAAAVGDDHIQGEVSGGQVQPDTWTHGSSDQRRHWFTVGYQTGSVPKCDTFAASRV